MTTAANTRYGKWTRRNDLDEERVAHIRAEMEAAAQRLRDIRSSG